MAPTLRALSDGQPRTAPVVRDAVAAELGITDQDRRLTRESGGVVFDSRVSWALTYMAQAGLVRRPKRGVNQITERGQNVLAEHPERIDNHVLAIRRSRAARANGGCFN
jgi:restriction system protein